MLAYLAAYTPEAPEFPLPLPSVEETVEDADMVVEASADEAAPADAVAPDA